MKQLSPKCPSSKANISDKDLGTLNLPTECRKGSTITSKVLSK